MHVPYPLVHTVDKSTYRPLPILNVSGGWKKYDYALTTGDDPVSTNNRLRLYVTKPRTFWFSLVSLFPPTYKNRINGNRIDLMEKMLSVWFECKYGTCGRSCWPSGGMGFRQQEF